jgi:hypothetical protein
MSTGSSYCAAAACLSSLVILGLYYYYQSQGDVDQYCDLI